ncbi:MAG TPA: septum formation initiator family protein [Bacteroidales bacterium]|nr:septum formation initiator family protein [Bacteroidales bacterium]
MVRFKIIDKIPTAFRNKYFLTVLIFIIWLTLFDSNNLISRYKELRELYKLRNEREYFSKRIEEDRKKLHELKTDNDNLEKFAREQYRMKKPDEDLYIIMTPSEDRKNNRRNN